MKKTLLTMLMCLVVFVFWTGSISAESEDPTGTLQQIQDLNEAHRLAVEAVVGNVCLDYYPELGTILPEAYPVSPLGLTPEEIQARFVQELEEKGYEITQLTMTQNTLSGRALVEHLVDNQQIFVWHELTNAPVTVISGTTFRDGKCYRVIRVWVQTCTNGAGYWDWQYIEVPCDEYNFAINYYSNQAQLSPYPFNSWPSPPPIDPTGTFDAIHALNEAHRAQIDAIINNVAVDEHFIYGCVGVDEYPVSTEEMTMEDAYAIMAAQTEGMELLESSVEQLTISGKVLSEHLIEGQQVWVWHEYDQTPIFAGTALVRTPDVIPDASVYGISKPAYINVPGGPSTGGIGIKKCYVWKYVWIPPCTNGLVPGYWTWKWVEVPCFDILQPKLKIDYSLGLGVLAYDL